MESKQWQSLLARGNSCYENNQFQQAELFYSEAYDLLAFGYRNDPLCMETMMAWICSCHNLSSLYEKIGKLTLSLKFLTVPHEYLTSITETKRASDHIKLLALQGLSLTLPPILSFSQKHPMCYECFEQISCSEPAVNPSLERAH